MVGPVTRPAPRSWTRPARAGWLTVAVALTAACNSGAKNTSAPATTSASSPSPHGSSASSPTSSLATGASTTGAGTCRAGSGAAPGAPGGGDVTVAGDIPDTQAYVAYQSPDGFRVSVPEGWARSQTAGAVTFTDKFNSIRVQVTSASAAPSPSSAQSTEVPALAASSPCFQPGKVTEVSRKAGQAVLITFRADSPADPVTGKVVHQDVERYEFWQASRLAVLTLSSPQGSDNVDPWRKVTDTFAWGS